jgi:hypothetical protein
MYGDWMPKPGLYQGGQPADVVRPDGTYPKLGPAAAHHRHS